MRNFFALCFLAGSIALVCSRVQKWVSLETFVGVDLPGCKVLNGRYKYTNSNQEKIVDLVQAGCKGREIESGALFTVYGNKITIPQDLQREPARGTIEDDGNINWNDGQVWLLIPEPTKNPRTFAKPLAKAAEPAKGCTGRNCKCATIGGVYNEIDPNNPDDPNAPTVSYRQMGCSGADLTHGAPFEMKGNKIVLMYGDENEGEVQDDGSILWSNGFIHKPKKGMKIFSSKMKYQGDDAKAVDTQKPPTKEA